MSSLLFQLGNLIVMPFWFAMVFAPRWSVTRRVMRSWWAPALPALPYAVLAVPGLPALLPLLARPELEAIAPLLGSADGATLAWLHFLAFDLFVGRAVFLDAEERGLPLWLRSPVLVLVLLMGPLGYLLHLAARTFYRRNAPA